VRAKTRLETNTRVKQPTVPPIFNVRKNISLATTVKEPPAKTTAPALIFLLIDSLKDYLQNYRQNTTRLNCTYSTIIVKI